MTGFSPLCLCAPFSPNEKRFRRPVRRPKATGAMAHNPKAAHYYQQLHATLLRGAWADSNPGRAPNGAVLDWSELLRKFRKHCTHHGDFANVVQQIQALALLMLSPSQSISPEALDGEVGDVSGPLPLKSEGVLRTERRDEALECLNGLGSANEKSHSTELVHTMHMLSEIQANVSPFFLQVDFTSFEVRTGVTPLHASSQAPATMSTMRTAESATSNIEPVLSRTVSASGSMGVGSTTRHLENLCFPLACHLPTLGNGLIYTLFIRALCLSSSFTSLPQPMPITPASLSTPISVADESGYSQAASSDPAQKVAWYAECRVLAEEYRRILEVVTRFPKAGEQNTLVNDFVDMSVGIWERGGCDEAQTDWIIDILWWATRLTFYSQRIMRHLTRLLLASSDFPQAKRTFKLYVQLVSKGRQTSAGEVSLQLQRRAQEDLLADHPSVIASEEMCENGSKADSRGDRDSDQTFVGAMLFGVRMLCRYGDGDDVREARKVWDVIEDVMREGQGWQKRTLTDVNITHGILCMRLADFGALTYLRYCRLHFTLTNVPIFKAADLDPLSLTAFYQLALAQSALRQVDAAVISARAVLELAPKDTQEWDKASQIIELCMARTEEETEADPARNETVNGYATRSIPGNDGYRATGGAHPASILCETPIANGTTPVIEARSPKIPSAASLQYGLTGTPFVSKIEKFESSIQLLLTQLAIVERVEGAEVANEKWPDVFKFFSTHCLSGPSVPSRLTKLKPRSVDSNQGASLDLPPSTTTMQNASSGSTSVPRIEVEVPTSPTRTAIIVIVPPQSSSMSWIDERGETSRHGPYHSTPGARPSFYGLAFTRIRSRASRRRSPVGSYFRGQGGHSSRDRTPSPPPLLSNTLHTLRENRLLSELWLTSAATFRRMGRLDEAKRAIMEAEVLDETNPNVWVQLGLYYAGMDDIAHATESLSKALVIDQDNVAATIHLAQIYLLPGACDPSASRSPADCKAAGAGMVAGMLDGFTRRAVGWDVLRRGTFWEKLPGCRGVRNAKGNA
ncbi:hypothetical protein BS47DRAFT_1397092 [Hydnum rufescens UP504]|uniref:TPR-like protein n=1 Tax=Hydnum rufescens UP504 TaxID=1448309 RepID=A0A9P6ANX7_9AGAM|nr:hypothetical protein BS47DRAFT_1397092 [Hydnum rufescens UP504]